MQLTDVLKKENIILNLSATNQNEVIEELVDKLFKNKVIENKLEFKNSILKREEEISTAIGDGIAIPHAQSKTVKEPAIVMGRSLEGIAYGGEVTNLFFMIAAPENTSNEHLILLSKLSSFLMNENFRAKLILARSEEDVIQAINSQEKLDLNKEIASNVDNGKYVIGITGCMTGIAHTYMAAESLKAAATKRGMRVKIQTNGANGPENILTNNDINEADAIIIAHDVDVDTSVFKNKKYVDVPVKKALSDADGLIDRALSYNTNNLEIEEDIIQEKTG